MSDRSIRKTILDGDSASIYLVPDPSVEDLSEKRIYEECYALPNVFVSQGELIGLTTKHHLVHIVGQGVLNQCGFVYTSYGIYLILSEYGLAALIDRTVFSGNIRPLSDYSVSEFRFRKQEIVWDSENAPENLEGFAAAVRDGAPMSMTIEHEDGLVQSGPIEMPFFFPDDGTFSVQSQIEFFPSEFLDVEGSLKVLRQPGAPLGPNGKPAQQVQFKKLRSTYVKALNTGRYYTLQDIRSDTPRPWKSLKLFREPTQHS